MKTIEYRGDRYPTLQGEGFASQYAFPFAQKFCKGDGFDIGCNRQEWVYPGAQGIDLNFDDGFDAFNLPARQVDYIFSSHCLEHLPDWVGALDYWAEHLKEGGAMFLYLPHFAQKYWRPWNNRKHINVLSPEMLRGYYEDRGYREIFVTEGYDLNHSFYAVAIK